MPPHDRKRHVEVPLRGPRRDGRVAALLPLGEHLQVLVEIDLGHQKVSVTTAIPVGAVVAATARDSPGYRMKPPSAGTGIRA